MTSTSAISSGSRLQPFGTNIWTVEGPVVSFFGFPYPTRMVVIKLSSGSCWVWSPIEWSEELGKEIEITCGGPVQFLVAPNKIHWLFLKQWQDKYPSATVYGAPGLDKRKVAQDVKIDKVLDDAPDPTYAADIDQVVFWGSLMDEVVFFHKPSKTVIFCDLIQRFPPEKGWKGFLMKLDDLVGENGSTPREWRLSFWWNGQQHLTRKALDKVLYEWQPDKLVIPHGECADQGATQVVERCLYWIPKNPRPRQCGCIPTTAESEKTE